MESLYYCKEHHSLALSLPLNRQRESRLKYCASNAQQFEGQKKTGIQIHSNSRSRFYTTQISNKKKLLTLTYFH